ncbi:PTS sugar transporter subunit IIA [Salicibibacter halophilus]|uniref:PTS sugar transporter subunit IIA n=1 Tax=Salicibibacter halophilus TaxID=2502791 RepID=A0A514LHV0_9BACI|nr:sucrose-specific PTS transporter subunit IIBC [Salicibibacter halophilus]QDI91426.1 PTS sugar transporter subunit IIA [Salicibibacter halophilus]
MAENQQIAKELIEAVGGEENIETVSHCATRLRIMVHDKEKIDQEKAENIEKVKGAFYNSGQYQVIFGTGTVNQIHEQFSELGTSGSRESEETTEAPKQGNWFQRVIRTFGDVFVPIIPVLVATGLFMGLRGLIMQEEVLALMGLTEDTIPDNFLLFTEVLTDTAFAFLPALIAWSAFRVFGGSPVIGIVLGLMLVNPELPDAWEVAEGTADPLLFFGFIEVSGYQASVLPAFIAGYIGAKLEKWIRKRVPEALDLILTPFLTLFVMIFLALFLIGPIFNTVEEAVMSGVVSLLELPFGISGLIIGFFHQIIVITGVHHIFNFLEVQLLQQFGENPFNAIITASTAAQGAAALAVGLKTKHKNLKAISLPSSLSAFLGVTEPAIFGVNLRYIRPFVMGLIGGAAGATFASIVGLAGTGMAITVIPGTLLYLDGQILLYLATNLISIGVAFSLTWMFGFSDNLREKMDHQ